MAVLVLGLGCGDDGAPMVEDATVGAGDGGVVLEDAAVESDGGLTIDDGGLRVEDAAASMIDAATVFDGGAAVSDGGVPMPDGGSPMPDAGSPMPDAGSPMPDAGSPMPDAGSPMPDAGIDAGPPPEPVVPNTAYCAPAQESVWMGGWTHAEEEVLRLVNEARARGADCGSEGRFSPTSPLTMQPQLRCAARVHSRDMTERGYFSHRTPEGAGPGERIDASGYRWRTWGENIAGSYPTPEAAVNGWLDSDGHCANIMNPNFDHIGVGYYGAEWTQVFGAM